jgi:hypothetical protein
MAMSSPCKPLGDRPKAQVTPHSPLPGYTPSPSLRALRA